MAKLEKDKLFDKRIVERNIAKGLISRDAYDKHIGGLGDMEAEAVPLLADPPEEEPTEATEGEAAETPETAPAKA